MVSGYVPVMETTAGGCCNGAETFFSTFPSLITCAGEPVDQLRFTDPAVLRYLADRPRSDGY
jgi:hypothetical protein